VDESFPRVYLARGPGLAPDPQADPIGPHAELRRLALAAWRITDPAAKCAAVAAMAEALRVPGIDCDATVMLGTENETGAGTEAGRPALPRLVHPAKVPQRGLGSPTGRIALLHAVAHIEFNAINLALDAVWRFQGLPQAYYLDWMHVAAEEAVHFGLLRDELERRGARYGDHDAHDGLWDMAVRTAHDPLVRMALVPRLLEARGLDVTPALQQRLAQAGDAVAVAILQRILDDEIGHVAIGNRWYRHLCGQRGLDPVAAWADIASRHGAASPRPPFNVAARVAAGFDRAELDAWNQ
jgi:uncharacterized ferritin-like protein (DUF455 family)